MSMKIRSGFISRALRTPSSPFSAAAVLNPCFSSAFCMTNTSVGESSTIRINGILYSPSFPDVSFDRSQQFVFGKRLGQIMFRSYDAAASPVEQTVLAGQHDHRNLFEHLVVLDQRTGLVSIEARHHDVHEHDVRLMVGDLGQCVETIDGSEHFAALLGQKSFSGPTNRLTVVDHENLEAREFRLAAGDHALQECVGAGILWLFNISGPRKPRYGVDISRHDDPNKSGLVHSFPKRACRTACARLDP